MYKSEWNIMEKLEPMLTGKELKEKMMVLPAYDKNIRNESQAVRLMHLNDLNTFYLPSDMSVEIYTKLLSCHDEVHAEEGEQACSHAEKYQCKKPKSRSE